VGERRLVLNQHRIKLARLKKKVIVSHVGKQFHLHTFKRKAPKLKKFGPLPDSRVRRPKTKALDPRVKLPRPKRLSEKRAGAMVGYYKTWPGLYTDVLINKTTGTSSTTVLVREGGYDWLRTVDTNKGDHKRPNAQRFTKSSVNHYNGLYEIEDQSSIDRRTGTLYTVPSEYSFSTPWPNTSVYNRALGKLYEQLRGDVDISIDLAESHKTKSMMRDTLRSMVHLATTFRKMKRSNPRDWGNLWLEFTYGWKPLANTIYSSAHRLMAPHPQGTTFLSLHASASETMFDQKKVDDFNGLSGVPRMILARRQDRVRFHCEFALVQSRLDELAGFTSLNPVSIAWELTPFSFVVDWFVNFGGYLRDFENALLYGSNFVGGYVTETSKTEFAWTVAGQNIFTDGIGRITRTTVSMGAGGSTAEKKRSVLGSIPFPRRPRFDPHLGSSRLISGAALLGQMLHSLEHPKAVPKGNFEKKASNFAAWAQVSQKLWAQQFRKR
jgi:hypothetical protein